MFHYVNGRTLRSGTINTPRDPRVTERQSVPKTFVASDPLTSVTSHDMNGIKIAGRETLGTERAKTVPQAVPLDIVKTPSVYVLQRKGKHAGVVRTLDIDDDAALPRYVVPVKVKATPSVKVPTVPSDDAERDARRAARQAEDAGIMAYLRSIGYTGTLTSDIRSLALDTLAHAATVAAYEADKR